MTPYREMVEKFGKCLASETVNPQFYNLALHGAIEHLKREFPRISSCEIVDDLIKARRLETAKNEEITNDYP